jgi:hypothetical protein
MDVKDCQNLLCEAVKNLLLDSSQTLLSFDVERRMTATVDNQTVCVCRSEYESFARCALCRWSGLFAVKV